MILKQVLTMGAIVILVAACAGAPVAPIADSSASATSCISFFKMLDNAVADQGLKDGGESLIHGFPYLRTNRFLSSYRHASLTDKAFEAWVDRLASLDFAARKIELGNLPADALRTLLLSIPEDMGPGRDLMSAVAGCAQLLRKQHFSTQAGRSLLQKQAIVPPDYKSGQRIIGLYALSRMPVAYGIHRWQKRTAAKFRKPLDVLPIQGRLIRFTPPSSGRLESASQVAELLRRSSQNPLALPEPNQEEQVRLFATFAPIFEVDIVSKDDRIGAPYWPETGKNPAVESSRPMVYRRLSHTRFQGRSLLQLNYIVWFPSRPCTSAVDILCGHMDGINWRVTLSPAGEPLLFDSIHNCGCYHLFFPTRHIFQKRLETLNETAFVPQRAPELLPSQRLVLRIASGSHHIEALYAGELNDGNQEEYSWADYSRLRALPRKDGSRQSLFQPNGLVPGTVRKERWLLWPMGVASPGSMRQWGRHATAFVGRRHFDDPCLIESNFFAAERDASSGAPIGQASNDLLCSEKSGP